MTPGLRRREAGAAGQGRGRATSLGVSGSHPALQLTASGAVPALPQFPRLQQPGRGSGVEGREARPPIPATAQARPGLQLQLTWRGGARQGRGRHLPWPDWAQAGGGRGAPGAFAERP